MGFKYDNISSQSMDIKARLTSWQTVPPLRNSFVSVPGKPGIVDFGSRSTERVIMLRCNVFPRHGFHDLVSVLDGVAEWLNPEQGVKQLMLDDVPDRFFNARLSEEVDCSRLILSAGAFDLRFICPDPFAYALVDEVFIISATGAHTVARVKGNTDSEPVYSLKGVIPSGSSSYVSIKTNGAELRVPGALASGETLIIDSGRFTAVVVDSQGAVLRNGLPLLQDLNFPTLHKGNNTVNITATGGAVFTELKIQAMSRWR